MRRYLLFIGLVCMMNGVVGQSNTPKISYEKKFLFNDSRFYQVKDTSFDLVYHRYGDDLISVTMNYAQSKKLHSEFIKKDASTFYFLEYDTLGNTITKGVLYMATKPIRTDTLKSMSPITLKTDKILYQQNYRLKRTDNWEYFLVDSIHEKEVTYKNDTVFRTTIFNKLMGLSHDSIPSQLVGLWYAHVLPSNASFLLLTKNNKDYNFNFTTDFHRDFTYKSHLRFVETIEDKRLGEGKWSIMSPCTILLSFEDGSEKRYKIAYLSEDIIILNII
jgi:hypothetical protein